MTWTRQGATRTGTTAHIQWAAAVLRRDHHQCQLRIPGRCTGHATEADHVIAVHLGGPEYDIDNGRAACAPCHRKRSSEQGNAARDAQGRQHRQPGTHPGLRTD